MKCNLRIVCPGIREVDRSGNRRRGIQLWFGGLEFCGGVEEVDEETEGGEYRRPQPHSQISEAKNVRDITGNDGLSYDISILLHNSFLLCN
jgi:hypothetical protein